MFHLFFSALLSLFDDAIMIFYQFKTDQEDVCVSYSFFRHVIEKFMNAVIYCIALTSVVYTETCTPHTLR